MNSMTDALMTGTQRLTRDRCGRNTNQITRYLFVAKTIFRSFRPKEMTEIAATDNSMRLNLADDNKPSALLVALLFCYVFPNSKIFSEVLELLPQPSLVLVHQASFLSNVFLVRLAFPHRQSSVKSDDRPNKANTKQQTLHPLQVMNATRN